MAESPPVERESQEGRDAGASVAQVLLALVVLAVAALVVVVALRRVL